MGQVARVAVRLLDRAGLLGVAAGERDLVLPVREHARERRPPGPAADHNNPHDPGRPSLPPGGAGLRDGLTPLPELQPAGRTSVLSHRPTHRERRPRNVSELTSAGRSRSTPARRRG